MVTPVNFLPWREQRRARCLRFWGVLFIGSLLVVSTLYLRYRANVDIQGRINAIWLQGEKTRVDGLRANAGRVRQRQAAAQRLIERRERQEQTRRWRTVLQGLANEMPDQAWLTRLSWQQNSLNVAGQALTFSALRSLEALLRRLPAFQLDSRGTAAQDAQGRWQFQYRLVGRRNADSPH